VARGGFIAVQTSFVLAVGCSWEGAFAEAVAAMSYRFEDKKVRAYMDALMTIMLCMAIFPAWIWYMLPKALAGPVPLEPLLPKVEKVDPKALGAADEFGSNEVPPEGEAGSGEACQSCGTQFEEDTSVFCQNCGERRSPTTEGEATKGTLGAYSKSRDGKKTTQDTVATPPVTNQAVEPEGSDARLSSGAYSSNRGQPVAARGASSLTMTTPPVTNQAVEPEESDARLSSGAYGSNRGQPASARGGGGKAGASGGKGGRQSTGKAQPQQGDDNWTGGGGEDQQNEYVEGEML